MTVRWGDIKIGQVISPVKGELISGDPGLPITGISTDSREILEGSIFFALKGERFDGHDFVRTAIDKGVSCIIADRGHGIIVPEGAKTALIRVEDTLNALGDLASWWRHQFNVKVAALTGSAGKTTTKELTAHILELTSDTVRTTGNFNNLIGLPLTVFRINEKTGRAVLEMGMNHYGEIARLTEIADPDVGLITNVGRAHLEGLGDIYGVARAKTELVDRMSPEGRVILNGDDEILMKEALRFKREVMTFGLGAENDVRAADVKSLGKDGVSFKLQYKNDAIPVILSLSGIHNVLNALAAASIALSMGEGFGNIALGLKRYNGLKGRFKSVTLAGDITLVDDTYNANPSSVRAALSSIRELAGEGKRVIAGLGEMLELGDETIPAHIDAGRMAAEIGVAWLFAIGAHSGEIKQGALNNGLARDRVVEVATHEEMVKRIQEVLEPGDVILLKGSRRIGLDAVARGLEEGWPKEG